jgi:hypothetical protein
MQGSHIGIGFSFPSPPLGISFSFPSPNSSCDVSVFFIGDVHEDELLVMTLTLFWAPRSFILSFVGERAPTYRNLKDVSRILH